MQNNKKRFNIYKKLDNYVKNVTSLISVNTFGRDHIFSKEIKLKNAPITKAVSTPLMVPMMNVPSVRMKSSSKENTDIRIDRIIAF